MNGHGGRYDLSVKCTLKSKQSQPSPLTLATESYGYALTGRVERLSANHPPVAPLRLQAYRDTAGSLGDDDDELMLNVLRCHLTY